MKQAKGLSKTATQNPFHAFWYILEVSVDILFIKVMYVTQFLACQFLSRMSIFFHLCHILELSQWTTLVQQDLILVNKVKYTYFSLVYFLYNSSLKGQMTVYFIYFDSLFSALVFFLKISYFHIYTHYDIY